MFCRVVEVVNAGSLDLDDFAGLFTDDVEVIPYRAAVQGTVYRGAAGLRAFLADNEASFQAYEISFDDVREVGDHRVLGIGRFRIVGRASGAEATQVTAGVAEFRDGRICRWEDFGDAERARAAAGLSDPS
jgi:ketosteroid isomerase-like protein